MVLAFGCAVLGVIVGRALTVVVERVPARAPLGPDLARLARRPLGPTPGRHSPALEAATAVLFAGAALRLGADAALPAFLVLFAALVAITVIDLEHYIVPNRIVFPVLVASVVLLGLAALVDGDWSSLRTGLVGAVAAGGGLLAINLVSPAGMGMGDVKLALVLGLFLGWLELPLVFAGLFLGFLLGAVGGVVLIALGRRSRRDHVPFAPFLAGGTVLAVLVGGPLAGWFFG
ncbi:MAG TPA: A24 family peptidase [Acidimicrobiales bacterium]|nr:A24 family peptidase [Acidimicrobiales bacterium]